MTTIKWIILTLFLSTLLASPVWVLPDQDPPVQSQEQQNLIPGDPECCVLGLDCCTTPPD
ncbi:MAG: hypothetical protein HY314_01555 [Acidobacteria bacterium]|nr:hypothetical protein [Acidobacteriota bacterium]